MHFQEKSQNRNQRDQKVRRRKYANRCNFFSLLKFYLARMLEFTQSLISLSGAMVLEMYPEK